MEMLDNMLNMDKILDMALLDLWKETLSIFVKFKNKTIKFGVNDRSTVIFEDIKVSDDIEYDLNYNV